SVTSLCAHSARRHLRSFPTRRSSDLPCLGGCTACPGRSVVRAGGEVRPGDDGDLLVAEIDEVPDSEVPALEIIAQRAGAHPVGRSEEHTSELQSRFDLVCRLLLEKKK